MLSKINKIDFASVFSETYCIPSMIPCVDGIRFVSDESQHECHIYNNGIAECFFPLHMLNRVNGNSNQVFFPSKNVWEIIEKTYTGYAEVFKSINHGQRVFICFSLIGCQGLVIPGSQELDTHIGTIDRNELVCNPVVIEDISDDVETDLIMKKLHIEYMLSIGIKDDKILDGLIKEVYGE